jgi:hypothetical protein
MSKCLNFPDILNLIDVEMSMSEFLRISEVSSILRCLNFPDILDIINVEMS